MIRTVDVNLSEGCQCNSTPKVRVATVDTAHVLEESWPSYHQEPYRPLVDWLAVDASLVRLLFDRPCWKRWTKRGTRC